MSSVQIRDPRTIDILVTSGNNGTMLQGTSRLGSLALRELGLHGGAVARQCTPCPEDFIWFDILIDIVDPEVLEDALCALEVQELNLKIILN